MQNFCVHSLNDCPSAESSDNRTRESSNGLRPSDNSGVGVERDGDDTDESKGEILNRLSCDHVVDAGDCQ